VKKAQVKRMMGAGVVAGALYAAWRAYRARLPTPAAESSWAPAPFPFPPIPRPSSAPPVSADRDLERSHVERSHVERSDVEGSTEPVEGTCPASHPVKGKLTSGIYHLPGGLNYERTRADRCYVDAAAAESDGLRPAKR
jgi:hypothetical protein